MRLLVVDPGLSSRHGHNAAVIEELARHAQEAGGIALSCATSVQFDPRAFADVPCRWRPVFRLHGYARFGGGPQAGPELLARAMADPALRRQWAPCEEDLDGLRVQDLG